MVGFRPRATMYWVVCLAWLCVATQATEPPEELVLPYYHELSKQTFTLPDRRRNDSYFGFSITYDNYCKSLVVSSPRYDRIGKVYDCDIKTERCVPLIKDAEPVEDSQKPYTHDLWLGATVKAAPDFIVTCAPRHTDQWMSGKIGTFAQCFTRDKNSTKLTLRLPIADISRNSDYIETNEKIGYQKIERFMDSFGWSIDVAPTQKRPPVIVGGPAMYTGRVMVYDDINKTPKLLERKRSQDLPEYNFGYSVASGYLFNRRQLVYAVGSTYGREGSGSVHFFNTEQKRLSQLERSDVEDLVVGSMFGAVLCAARFYSNGLDHLLVGAPTFAGKHDINTGSVHVYVAHEKTRNNMQLQRIIKNGIDSSYFGSAIANLGDLNGDKCDEIAIAAPYENDGRGAVYLYSGAKIIGTKSLSWMQRIQPEGFRSFGLSLTALHDYDENGCNELAVGAPYNDTVVLYRCMAAITVELKTQFPPVQDRTRDNKTNFDYRVCFIVTYPEKPKEIIADISTRVVFTHSSAKLTNPGSDGAYTFNTSLADRKKKLHCASVGFTLPPDGNYETEIAIDVTSKLLNDPYSRTSFDQSRVVLSDRSVLKKRHSEWVAECSGYKECTPNLTLTFIDKTIIPYVIGSSEREEFSISVFNTGDIAYESSVLVRVFGATVHSASQQCVPPKDADEIPPAHGADDLLCTPKNPIKTNDTWNSGAILLNMVNLTNKVDSIKIQALLFNHHKDFNKSNKTYEHIIRMKNDPNYITIKGISNLGEAANITRNEINTGKVMEHRYTIKNTGTGQWEDAKCEIVLEKRPFITYLNIDVSTKQKTYKCTQTSETSKITKSTCKLPPIRKDSTIELVIIIQVMSETTDKIPEEGIIAKSTVELHLDTVVRTVSTSTMIRVHDAIVAWWVILIAVIFGLIILAIIAFILYECGFLRREKKKDLQALRKSIRRQTMRISAVPADDHMQILDHVEEENEGTQQIDNRSSCGALEDKQIQHADDSNQCQKKQ